MVLRAGRYEMRGNGPRGSQCGGVAEPQRKILCWPHADHQHRGCAVVAERHSLPIDGQVLLAPRDMRRAAGRGRLRGI